MDHSRKPLIMVVAILNTPGKVSPRMREANGKNGQGRRGDFEPQEDMMKSTTRRAVKRCVKEMRIFPFPFSFPFANIGKSDLGQDIHVAKKAYIFVNGGTCQISQNSHVSSFSEEGTYVNEGTWIHLYPGSNVCKLKQCHWPMVYTKLTT